MRRAAVHEVASPVLNQPTYPQLLHILQYLMYLAHLARTYLVRLVRLLVVGRFVLWRRTQPRENKRTVQQVTLSL